MLKKLLFLPLAVSFCSLGAGAAIVVTAPPAGQTNVRSCNEYSTDVLRDKWDMSQRTDLGWRIYNTVELPPSNLANIAFSGGIFSAVTTSADPNINILDSHYLGSVPAGKVGAVFPINADKYTVLIMRASFDPSVESTLGVIYWSANTIYDGVSWSYPVYIFKGWAYYAFDLPAIGTWGTSGASGAWAGNIGSLRIDPTQESGKTYQIDWIRLVENDAALRQTISWSGNSGNVDVYLDNNNNPADGTLGILARNVAGQSTSFLAGGLEAGDYYAVVVSTGANPAGGAASPGYYRVNDTPVLTFTKPTAEGSTEDFATVTFNDPWDMANLQDVEYTANQTGGQFTTLSYYDQAGTLFQNRTVYKATSAPTTATAGDPFINLLYWDGRVRGRNREINADRYHNLVATFGIAGAWNVWDGSIARIVWKRSTEMAENVSQDVIVRHLNDNSADWGQTVLNKFVFDMKTIPHETDPGGSPSMSGWGGWVDGFRLDPHEFPQAREFYFDDVRLTADWRADASFPITWNVAHTGGTTTVSLYYDTDNSGYDGALIASGLTGTSATWNCSGVPEGTYWIYAAYTDGTNSGQCYAGGPVIIEHHGVPQIRLSREFINIGAIQNGAITSPTQVLLTNAGTGTLNWTVSIPAQNPFLSVSPMSGTGNATLMITVDSSKLGGPGPTYGIITVTDPAALNSPQVIEIWGNIYPAGGSGVPFGDFATPLNNTTGVTGAIPVTGWVLDDIETTSVQIWRDPVAGTDLPGAIGANGLVYIGQALFVEGARPDIEVGYPAWPLHYRAGWGYMLLTNFLPAQGNGTFRLHALAADKEGHVVSLGARTITCGNASAVKPFGTIDTPAGGQAVSGTFFNFGWVLTPLPGTVPKDGHSITVYVDGVLLGNLSTPPNVYNAYRSDVSNNFPGLNNSAGPVGAFNLDTTGYLNGVHMIYWIAYDDLGRGDGIGSRYFSISNVGGAPMAADPALDLPTDRSGLLRIGLVPDGERPEEAGAGFRLKPAPLKRGVREGGPISVEVEELGFVELRFRPESLIRDGSSPRFIGWTDGASKLLPIGSTLDPETGVFSWIPGPGFLGRHLLHFAVSDGVRKSAPLTVAVEIVPKKTMR